MKEHETGEGTAPRGHKLAVPGINVTPLIDVLLVLLIIFMVIQPQTQAKFESQIPQKPDLGKTDRPAAPDDPLMIDVKAGAGLAQVIELNSRPMTLLELATTLRTHPKTFFKVMRAQAR